MEMHAPADLREIAIFWGQLRRARMHESNACTRISELRGEEIATSGDYQCQNKNVRSKAQARE
jgi:hypothetical protein